MKTVKNTKTIVYITRYALSKGIKVLEAEVLLEREEGSSYKYIRDGYGFLYINKDFFLTKSEAIKKAEEMKKKKLLSLRKQVEKLEKMTFD